MQRRADALHTAPHVKWYGTCQGMYSNTFYALHGPISQALNYNDTLLAIHQLKTCMVRVN